MPAANGERHLNSAGHQSPLSSRSRIFRGACRVCALDAGPDLVSTYSAPVLVHITSQGMYLLRIFDAWHATFSIPAEDRVLRGQGTAG